MEKPTLEIQLYYSEDYAKTHDMIQRVWSVLSVLFFLLLKDSISYFQQLSIVFQIFTAIFFIAFFFLPSILYYFFVK
jgi:hypothetical protein